MTHKYSMESLEKYSVSRMFLLYAVQLCSFIEFLMLRIISEQEILITASKGGSFELAVANALFLDGWEPERFSAFCSLYCLFSLSLCGFSVVDNISDTHSRRPVLLWPTFNMPVLKDMRGLV